MFLFFYIQIGVIKKVKFTLLSYNIVYKYLSVQFNKMKNCRNFLFLKRTTLQINQLSFTQISEPQNPYKPLIFIHKHNIFFVQRFTSKKLAYPIFTRKKPIFSWIIDIKHKYIANKNRTYTLFLHFLENFFRTKINNKTSNHT